MADNDRFAPAVPPVLLLTGMVFFAIFPRLLLAPLLLRVAADFQIGYEQASSFFLSVSLGFVCGLLASGFVAGRLNHFRTILVSTALAGASLLSVMAVQDSWSFHVALLIIGFANGLYPGSGIATVSAIVPDMHRSKALAIHELGPNFAFILAPVSCAALAPLVGWKGVYILSGVAALLAASAFVFLGKREVGSVDAPNFHNLRLFMGNRAYWVVVLIFSVAAAGAIGVYSVLPTFLIVEHGLPEQTVNTLVGVSRAGAIVSIFAAGLLADRFGFRPVALVMLLFSGLTTALLGIASGALLIVAVFLQPLILQAVFPLGMSAVTRITPPTARNLAVVLPVVFANSLGAGVTPRVFGALAEGGHFAAGFVGLGLILLATIGTLRWVTD